MCIYMCVQKIIYLELVSDVLSLTMFPTIFLPRYGDLFRDIDISRHGAYLLR